MVFIHIIRNTKSFNKNLIEMMRLEGFSCDQHKIVSLSTDNKTDNNIIYFNGDIASAVNKYAKIADMVFVHNFEMTPIELFRLNKKVLNRVTWVEWGHDLYFDRDYKVINFKTFIKRILAPWFIALKKYKLSNVYAIGLPNIYDGLEARRLFKGKQRLFLLNYCDPNMTDEKVSYIKNSVRDKNQKIGILVGHSSYPYDKHIKILKHLNSMNSSNTVAIIPLSYGDMEYKEKILNYLQEEYKYDYIVLDEKMSSNEYWRYINKNIDIAILAGEGQNALGTLSKLAKLGKKIYINKEHVFYQRLLFESKEIMTLDDFMKEEIKDIVNLEKYPTIIESQADFSGNQKILNGWFVSINEIKKDLDGER